MISGVLSGARAWVGRRSRGQRVGAVAGIALLATAPFGGLEATAPEPLGTVEVGEPFQVGPFEVTVARVVSVPDLEPIARPDRKRNRLIGIVAEVRNVTDRPEYLLLYTDGVVASGAGITGRDPELFVVADGTRPSELNPGMSAEMVIVLEHRPGTGDEVELAVHDHVFVEDSVLTLDEDYWRRDEVAATGTFTIEERE